MAQAILLTQTETGELVVNGKLVASAASFMILLSACTKIFTEGAPTQSSPLIEQLAFNPFDRADARPEVLLSGLLQGRLTTNGMCVVIRAGDRAVTPLWPAGTTLQSRGRTVVLVLPDGRGTAAFESRVNIAGGQLADADLSLLDDGPRRACPSQFYVVSTIHSVRP